MVVDSLPQQVYDDLDRVLTAWNLKKDDCASLVGGGIVVTDAHTSTEACVLEGFGLGLGFFTRV